MQTACRRGNFGDNIKTDLLGIGSVHVLSPEREREREKESRRKLYWIYYLIHCCV